MTLIYIMGFFAVYGIFRFCSDIGAKLKKTRKAQEKAQVIMKIYGKKDKTSP